VRGSRRNRTVKSLLSFVIAAAGLAVLPLAALPWAASAAVGQAPSGASPAASGASAAGTAPRLPGDERRVCPVASGSGQMACQSVFRLAASRPGAPAFAARTAKVPGYGPSVLRRAYGLTRQSPSKGRGETIAIVDAFRDPDASANLARYRAHFGLGSCRKSSGCLRIVNQKGKAGPLPRPNAGWAAEESLDLDMVSAICPRCRILLVEASAPTTVSLGTAEDAAVAKGGRFVSNSWSGSESAGKGRFNHYFNHPGDAIVFASGDDGYGPVYPADLQYVTSVGGTTLRHAPSGSRAWTETAWGTAQAGSSGTGSGCSPRAKPSWQRKPVDIGPHGCPNRTQNDVAAVGDPATGVAVYDTYRTGGTWGVVGGTSVATPIVTAVYALAGTPARRSYPAAYLYQHPAGFHDVKSGVNGSCPALSRYLCHGVNGYDGPTGVGTPRGASSFSSRGTSPITLVDPGPKLTSAGATLSVKITGLDTRAAAVRLAYAATGLPGGLSIASVPGSSNGILTGKVSASIPPGTTFNVLVRATDHKTRATAATRFTIHVT
jgi:hypothetical protein